jgi:tetratricopeptide (TPR) repeat protein
MLGDMKMRTRATILLSTILILSLSVACSRDPEKAKRRYLESGQRYVQQQKYAEAQIQFKNALKIDPRYVDAFYELGKSQVAMRQGQDALKSYMQALTLAPNRDDIRLDLAKLYLGGSLPKEAEQEATTVTEHNPNNAQAYQVIGTAMVGREKVREGLEAFNKCISLLPNDANCYVSAGLAHVVLKEYPQAEQLLKKAIELDPNGLQAYRSLANYYILMRDLGKADEALVAGLSHLPNSLELYMSRAEIFWAQQKPDQVATVVQQLRSRVGDNSTVSIAVADFYAARQAHDNTIAELQHGLSIDKNNIQIKNRLVSEYLTVGKVSEAEQLNSTILKSNPKDVSARISNGRIMLARQQSKDAMTYLRSVVADAPENATAHYFLAIALQSINDLNQAQSELNEAIKYAPDSPDVLQALGVLQLNRGELQAASEYAQRKVNLYPTDVSGHLLYGRALMLQKKLVDAEQQYKAAVQLAGNNPEVFTAIGQFYSATGNSKMAEVQFENALRANNHFAPALAALLELLEKTNQGARAQSVIEQYVQNNPNDATAHSLYGQLLIKHKDLDRAKPEFERAIQLNPNETTAYVQLGGIYQQKGEVDAAISTFSKILTQQPNSAVVQLVIGNLYLDKRDYKNAKSYYEQAVANDPNLGVAAGNLAYLYTLDGGNLDVALSYAQKAKQLLPEVPAITDTLGWVLYKRSNYDSALPLLQECVQKDPQHAAFRYHLGMALMQTGKKDPAKRELEAALKLKLASPDSEDARKALDQLR